MTGGIVNVTPLLATPPAALTTTEPVLAEEGTFAEMLVSVHELIVALLPPKVTPPVPREPPKFDPFIVTVALAAPESGERLLILGEGTIVSIKLLLVSPAEVVKTTLPVTAPDGITKFTALLLQEVTEAGVPLTVTPPVPLEAPKPSPPRITADPMAPLPGVAASMRGSTVNAAPLLVTPVTVTTTLPVVAENGTLARIVPSLHEFTVAAIVPLNVTLLLPCVAPKPDPEIVTTVPVVPLVGVSELIVWQVLRVVPRSRKAITREANAKRKGIPGVLHTHGAAPKEDIRQPWYLSANLIS
jgi:hypothetical protein